MEGFNNDLIRHLQAVQEIILRRKFEEIKDIAQQKGETQLYIILSRGDLIGNPGQLKEWLNHYGYEIEIINAKPVMLPLDNPETMTYKAELRFDDIRIKISEIIIDH